MRQRNKPMLNKEKEGGTRRNKREIKESFLENGIRGARGSDKIS